MTSPGAFVSGLTWLDRFGQVPLNLLRGRVGSAGRQLADILGEAVDAPLPGDWIPQFTTPEDSTSVSEMAGVDRKASPTTAYALDALGALANPLTYVGLGSAAGGARRGAASLLTQAETIPRLGPMLSKARTAVEPKLDAIGRGTRSVFGEQRVNPLVAEAQASSSAKAFSTGKAVEHQLRGLFPAGKFTPQELNVAGDIVDGVLNRKPGRPPFADPSATVPERIRMHPEASGMDPVKLESIIRDSQKLMRDQAVEGGIGKPIPNVSAMLGAGGRPGGTKPDLPIFTSGPGVEDYIPRTYKGQSEKQRLDQLLGDYGDMSNPSPTKARKLDAQSDVTDYLAANPGVEYVGNLGERVINRATSQSQMAARAAAGDTILQGVKSGKVQISDPALHAEALSHDFRLADPKSKSLVDAAIKSMDPESAKVAADLFHGLPARGPILGTLAKVNNTIKPMMVFGYGMVKPGSLFRNRIGGVWQTASNPATRPAAVSQMKTLMSDMYGAFLDGLKIGDKTAKGVKMKAMEDAFDQAGGIQSRAREILQQSGHMDLVEMIDHGVFDGFVRAEDLISQMSTTPWKKTFRDIADAPARMFRGLEDRMRMGLFQELRKTMPAAKAAEETGNSLYKYNVTSLGNRTARDLIPFFQFTAKAIPQQAKFLSERGLGTTIATAMAAAQPKDDNPIYPWMEGKLNIPLGIDDKGRTNYLSGLGLPVEALTAIPNLSGDFREAGREVERNVIGASHPLLKSGWSWFSGHDPYFGTPTGSYRKNPAILQTLGMEPEGDFGKYYNLAKMTGLTQPVESTLQPLNMFSDDKGTAASDALDYFTGAKLDAVDPTLARQQQLTRTLEANPEVSQMRTFYSRDKDPKAQALLAELHQIYANRRKQQP